MSTTISTPATKQLSKSATRKQEKSEYWRTIQAHQKALKDEKDSFQQRVRVLTIKTTDCAESFSAIIDSRRGIIIK